MRASVSCAAAGICELISTICDQAVPQKIYIVVTPVKVEILSPLHGLDLMGMSEQLCFSSNQLSSYLEVFMTKTLAVYLP